MITLLKLEPEQIPIANISNIANSMDMDVYDRIINLITDSQREFMLPRINETQRQQLILHMRELIYEKK